MITIRTITLQLPHNLVFIERELDKLIANFFNLTDIYIKNGFQIRTKRIGLDSMCSAGKIVEEDKILGVTAKVNSYCKNAGARWFNIPFKLVGVDKHELAVVSNLAFRILKEYSNTFINFIVADDKNIDFTAIKSASSFILDVSKLDSAGFNNFRVGASANIIENTPFLPFTCSGEELGFSIGLEIPQEINGIIKEDMTLEEIRTAILGCLVPQLSLINDFSEELSKAINIKYLVIDSSLAPYPGKNGSVGEILQKLGCDNIGSNGTLFATSFLTNILKSFQKNNQIKTTGFCGVMYSILEDEFLSRANNSKCLTLDSLISYASICGCGVDMVPLPGNIFVEEISSIIVDVCAQAIRLNKPLGVRVLPVPYKNTNEFTDFNMDFLFNTRIFDVKNIIFKTNEKERLFTYIQ